MRACVNMHTMAIRTANCSPLSTRGFRSGPSCMTAAAFLAGRPRLGEFWTPLVVLDDAAMLANAATMASWCRERGLEIMPHGKTTMAPTLWRRQLDAGALGITLATMGQVRTARELRCRPRSCSPTRPSTNTRCVTSRRARRPRVPLRVLGRLARDRRGDGARPARGTAAAPGRRVRRARRRGRSHRCAHRRRRRRGRRAHRGLRRAAVGGRRGLRGMPGARPVAARARRGAGLPGRSDRAAPRRRAPLRRGRGVRHRGRQRLLRPGRGGVRPRPAGRERTRFTLRSGASLVHDDGFYRQISPFDEAAAGPDVPRFRVAMRGLARVVSHARAGAPCWTAASATSPTTRGSRSRGGSAADLAGPWRECPPRRFPP